MWSNGRDINGTRLYGMRKRDRRPHTLQVAAGFMASKVKSRHTVMAPVVLAAAAAVVGMVWYALALCFSLNNRFNIVNVDIRAGHIITPEKIRACTGIAEGQNLFSFNISNKRAELLANYPTLRTVTITRKLPDTVYMAVIEREPLARIGRTGQIVTDSEGVVFSAGGTSPNVPAILGVRTAAIRPGTLLEGMMLHALEVIESANDARLNLSLDSIEADRKDYLVLHVQHEGQIKQVNLNWKDMDRRTEESHRNLIKRMDILSRVLLSGRAQNFSRLDITHADDIVHMQ